MSSKLEEAFMEAYKENLIPADMVMEAFDGIKAAIHNHKEEKAANKSGNDPKLADKIYKKLSPYLPSNWKKFSISVADHKEDPNKYGVLMMITDSTGKTSDWTKLKCADRPEATRVMMNCANLLQKHQKEFDGTSFECSGVSLTFTQESGVRQYKFSYKKKKSE